MSTIDLRMSGVHLRVSWFTFHRNSGVKHKIVFKAESVKNRQKFCDKFLMFDKKGFRVHLQSSVSIFEGNLLLP